MVWSAAEVRGALRVLGVDDPDVKYVDYGDIIIATRRERGFTSAPVRIYLRRSGRPTREEIELLAGMLGSMPCPRWEDALSHWLP